MKPHTRLNFLGHEVCDECGYRTGQHSEDCSVPFLGERDPDWDARAEQGISPDDVDYEPDVDVCDDCGGVNGLHRFGIDH